MKYDTLLNLGDIELQKKKNILKESIMVFRIETSLGNNVKDTRLVRNSKKNIARILTIKNKREVL